LVHYSTDYVFSGKNKEGYQESAQPDPINAYGRSKCLGERLLQKNCANYYLIRTAWLYGEGGKNFVNTVVELAKSGKELKMVNDQFGNPTCVKDLAAATHRLMRANQGFGIYHRTNSGSCSWYELALEIKRQTGFDSEVRPVSSKDCPRPALRPRYSKLINTKLEELRPWPEALKEYLTNLK